MLEFHAHKFMPVCTGLVVMGRWSRSLEARHLQANQDNEFAKELERTQKAVRTILPTLTAMGLSLSARYARYFLDLNSQQNNSGFLRSLQFETDRLLTTIHEELKSRRTIMIPMDRAIFYQVEGTFLGPDVCDRFPEVIGDAQEAGNCYALERYTACVFHLMKIMEYIVQKLGKKFKISGLETKTWGKILKDVKDKIQDMPHDIPRREAKKMKYHNCYALLDAVCHATRNPIMHCRLGRLSKRYDKDEAKDLMDRVGSFVEHFATLR